MTFDPLVPAGLEDQDRDLAELRQRCPVSEVREGFYFVTRDEDVRRALRDHRSLSNIGNFQMTTDVHDEETPTVVHLDPPRHTRLRRLLLSAFTPTMVTAAEPFIRDTARRMIDEVADTGHCDLLAAIAKPLPAVVISHMIGVPDTDSARFSAWTDEITAHLPSRGEELPARHSFESYLQAMIEDRRRADQPPDDLVGRLLDAEVDGLRLADSDITATLFQLILAGEDTVTRLIVNTTYELLRHGAWGAVVADPQLLSNALEETLRLDPPIRFTMRTCVAPTTIGDTDVESAKRVLLSLASANRDETRWPDPTDFRLDREHGADHLAFGYGIHTCLGSHLGRLEARVAMEELLARLPDLQLAPGFRYEPVPSPMFHGPQRLDVVWAP